MRSDDSGYITVRQENNDYYGGNQNLFPEKKLKGYGCGLIAASDVCMYLMDCPNTFEWDRYYEYVKQIEKYFFYLPFLGMSGISLSIGINLAFSRFKLPYHASWKVMPMGDKTRDRIMSMLSRGFPVIISIGPNFPNVFGKKRLSLYRKNDRGQYRPAGSVSGHYVVVTEFPEEGKMKISSWGQTYYIDWQEYLAYSRKKSISLFTNYLEIRPSSRRKGSAPKDRTDNNGPGRGEVPG